MILKKIRTYIIPAVVTVGVAVALVLGVKSGETTEVSRELHNSGQVSGTASVASVSDTSSLPASSDTCSKHEWKPLYVEEYVKTSDAVMSAVETCEICGENLGEMEMMLDEYGVRYWVCTSEQLSHEKTCFFKYCDDNSLDPYSQAVDITTSFTDYSWTPAVWEKQNTSTLIGYECSNCGEIIPQ